MLHVVPVLVVYSTDMGSCHIILFQTPHLTDLRSGQLRFQPIAMSVKVFFGVWPDKVLNAKVTTAMSVMQSVSSVSQAVCPKGTLYN